MACQSVARDFIRSRVISQHARAQASWHDEVSCRNRSANRCTAPAWRCHASRGSGSPLHCSALAVWCMSTHAGPPQRASQSICSPPPCCGISLCNAGHVAPQRLTPPHRASCLTIADALTSSSTVPRHGGALCSDATFVSPLRRAGI